MAGISGFNNQKKLGLSQFATVQGVGSDRHGIPAPQLYLTDLTPVAIAITATTTDEDFPNVQFIEVASHSARVGDVLRVSTGQLEGWEFEIVQVIDGDTLGVLEIGSENYEPLLLEVGDEVKTCRWVTAKSDSEGALTTSSGPVQFVRDATPVVVNEDTATPSNNRPLPAGLYVLKDGVAYPVEKNTIDPTQTFAIPVEVTGASGPINITAGDLNVQLSDAGPNFDATRIGDGSGIYLAINADGSINVGNISDVVTVLEATQLFTGAIIRSAADIIGDVPVGTAGQQKSLFISEIGQLLTYDHYLNGIAAITRDNTIAIVEGVGPSNATKSTDPDATATISGVVKGILQLILNSQAVIGAVNDPMNNDYGADGTVIANLKGILNLLEESVGGGIADLLPALEAIRDRLPAVLGQTDMDNSLAVTIANNQSPLAVEQEPLASTYAELLTIGTGAGQTIAIPSGAKWCKIQADDQNTANVRVKMGGTATTTSGIQFQAGRSEDFAAVSGATFSVCAESGSNQKLYVQFGA